MSEEREPKHKAWRRLMREGRLNEFCALRKQIYRKHYKRRPGFSKDNAFYDALKHFPPPGDDTTPTIAFDI